MEKKSNKNVEKIHEQTVDKGENMCYNTLVQTKDHPYF